MRIIDELRRARFITNQMREWRKGAYLEEKLSAELEAELRKNKRMQMLVETERRVDKKRREWRERQRELWWKYRAEAEEEADKEI